MCSTGDAEAFTGLRDGLGSGERDGKGGSAGVGAPTREGAHLESPGFDGPGDLDWSCGDDCEVARAGSRRERAGDRELRWSCVAGSGRERVGEGIRLEWNGHATFVTLGGAVTGTLSRAPAPPSHSPRHRPTYDNPPLHSL